MNVLFVPTLGLDTSLLSRLAASVDFPVKWKVAYNNGPEDALEHFQDTHPDWIIIDSLTGNKGVAGSWNTCAKLFPNEPSWLLMNDDAWFLPGYLEKICKCADQNLDRPVVYLNHTEAYYCFVWTQAGRKKYGEFDENLWPAYYEDCDYRLRLQMMASTLAVLPQALNPLDEPLPHGKPRSGGINYSAMIQGCGLLNRAYWRKKWGSDNHEKAVYQTPYKTPYKDHRLSIKDWVWDPAHRAKLYPLWEAFISQPQPSIYE